MNKNKRYFTDKIMCSECGKVDITGYYERNDAWVCSKCLENSLHQDSI